jgi:peptide/nickel transport system permease protein
VSVVEPTGAPVEIPVGEAPATQVRGRGTVRALLTNPSGIVGAFLTGLIALAALASYAGLTPFDPIAQHPMDRLQGPGGTYWLGTDQFGRDIFSRSISGAAGSLKVAVVAVALSGAVGTAAGLAAGYFGNAVRAPVLAVTNILFAFPPLLLALALASTFTRSWFTIAIAIAIVYVPIFIRVARGPVLSLRETDFVRAAVVAGLPTWRILLREILPNLLPVIIVQVTLSLSWAVLTEASLSFLGLGTPPPAASLGSMVLDARVLVTTAWWTMVSPGAVIVALVVGLNLLGDGLRDVLDPRRAARR